MSSEKLIPVFGLYGELSAESDPTHVHIETIDARSSLHDWEIKPHRHSDFTQVVIIRECQTKIYLEGQTKMVDAPIVVIAPLSCVHGFAFDPNTIGEVMTLARSFGEQRGEAVQSILSEPQIITLDNVTSDRLATLTALLLEVISEPLPGDRAFPLTLAEAAIRLIGQSQNHSDRSVKGSNKARQLVQLINRHFPERQPLAFYADALQMSQRSLGRLCTRHFGCSPQSLIHRQTIEEAIRLLRYSNASIAQIAWQLGFNDPSYFSRFYLGATGRRPRDDRNAALIDKD